jgi:hypothetical protein
LSSARSSQFNLLQVTGGCTAEVPVLRLRQAFWLAAVGGCKPDLFHNLISFGGGFL